MWGINKLELTKFMRRFHYVPLLSILVRYAGNKIVLLLECTEILIRKLTNILERNSAGMRGSFKSFTKMNLSTCLNKGYLILIYLFMSRHEVHS